MLTIETIMVITIRTEEEVVNEITTKTRAVRVLEQ